jgi:type IV pilus biogenesis protein CpaD/CtpE
MGCTVFRIVLMAAATVALAGCASSESTTQALFRADDAKCKSYDAKPSNDAYVQCRLAIDIQRANAETEAAQHQARTRP